MEIIINKLSCENNYQRFVISHYKDINKYRWSNWTSGCNTGEIIKSSGNALFSGGKLLLQKADISEIENNYKTWNDIDNFIDRLPVLQGVIIVSKF